LEIFENLREKGFDNFKLVHFYGGDEKNVRLKLLDINLSFYSNQQEQLTGFSYCCWGFS
jgi:hypothetical protein